MNDFESSARDADPYPYYQKLHQSEPIVWDSALGAWLVHDYQLCRNVLQRERDFNRADRFLQGGPENKGDPRSLALIDGKEHASLHRLYSQLIDDRRAESLRSSAIRPAADELLDGLVGRERADLAAEYADRLPLWAGFRILGWTPSYDELREEIYRLRVGRWKWNESMGRNAEEARISGDSVAANQKLLMPLIRAHQDGLGDDLICEIWRKGRLLLADWNEVDSYSLAQTQLGGETPYLLCNLIYLLGTDLALQQQLRGAPDLIPDFVEEGLRLVGPVHWQMRIATGDVELGPVIVRKHDRVLPMFAAANRDPKRFNDPEALDLERPNIKGHVAFGFGTRYCTGGSLARAEAREGVQRLLERLPPFVLDSQEESPRLAAFHVRSYRPLHITLM